MSTFQVTVLPITVENHPNADALELARIGAYLSVIRKGQFVTGDLVAYIPEDAILPPVLIEELGLTGKLAGSAKNRVKAVKLRGILSQGICVRAKPSWTPGQDVAGELGITKYEPVIPAAFYGDMMNVSTQRTLKYDIENFKRFSTVLVPGETVVMTEKCHGTFALFGFLSDDLRLPEEDDTARLIVSSKGLAARGLAFRVHSERNENNIYCRTARNLNLLPKVKEVFSLDRSVFILGEIFGPGVQDLSYGKTVQFRIFDIYLGNPGTGRFLNDSELDDACVKLGVARVPVLYRGPISLEALEAHTRGKETVSGHATHVREGVVVRPVMERVWSGDAILGGLPLGGRVQLKSVSEDYLFRKGNVTEFQ